MSDATHPLSSALADLRKELLKAQLDGAGEDLKFDITEIELDVKVVLTDTVDVGAKVGWKILEANAGINSQNQSLHTLKLKMTLRNQEGEKAGPISGAGRRPN